MRFGLITGGTTGSRGEGLGFDPGGEPDPKYRRYDLRFPDMLEEIRFAEEMGFDFVGCPEQHFLPDFCATSAPEVIYGAVAVQTQRIRIRSLITLLPFPINHPIRVAEQAATIDILSKGRYEIGTGRSNQALQLDAFDVPVDETRQRWREALQLICASYLNDPFSFDGDYFHVPDRTLVPKPLQQPHPPIFVGASSTESARVAGQMGIGLIGAGSFAGFHVLQSMIDAYREGQKQMDPVGGFVTDSMGVICLPTMCLETREEAYAAVRQRVADFTTVNDIVYSVLIARSKDYEYMKDLTGLDRLDDLDYIAEESGSALIGSPDDCIGQIKRFEAMGIEELTLGVDGLSHEFIMRTLEILGKYVLPEFKKAEAPYIKAAAPATAAGTGS